MPFKVTRLDIPDVLLIEPTRLEDERGFFVETYKASEFQAIGIRYGFLQDNHSRSKKGVLRGIHYQLKPKSQGKLVRVIRGAAFDVAVDMRMGSPFYGKWIGVTLSETKAQMLWIPPGLGHGFLALEDGTEVFYKTTEEYDPSLNRGVKWNDVDLDIKWPITRPLLSPPDTNHPSLVDAENNYVYEEA